MADMNSTLSNPVAVPRARNKTTRKGTSTPSDALPVYGVADGVLSFRHGLCVRERGVIDRAMEIIGRHLREPGAAFASPDAVKDYLRLALAGETHELFCVLYLDIQNRALAFENHFSGSLAQTSVYPREIVRAALAHHAAGVVLCHNHPSGNVQPSEVDSAVTQTLKAALSMIDVRVFDHVIVGADQTLSMAERGML